MAGQRNVTFTLTIAEDDGRETRARYSTAHQQTSVEGPLYPRDLELIAFLVRAIHAENKHGPDAIRGGDGHLFDDHRD